MAVTVQLDAAFDALRTLLDGRDKGEFTDAEFFYAVAECGPLFTTEIKHGATMLADGAVKLYEPSGLLSEFLTAIAARNGNRDDE